MSYQAINPYTEELVKSFPQHTDGDVESIIVKAEKTFATDWSLRALAERRTAVKPRRSSETDSTTWPN
jgi:succinate-semialdehyde dehydrogenase / glutarate-semialdehyde dehydrogenase